jgi:hypothetical protein
VSTRVTGSVTSKMVGGFSFADVPACKRRWPVNFDAGQATLAKMLDKVFGRQTENGSNRREVVCVWFLEVPAVNNILWSSRCIKKSLVNEKQPSESTCSFGGGMENKS